MLFLDVKWTIWIEQVKKWKYKQIEWVPTIPTLYSYLIFVPCRVHIFVYSFSLEKCLRPEGQPEEEEEEEVWVGPEGPREDWSSHQPHELPQGKFFISYVMHYV